MTETHETHAAAIAGVKLAYRLSGRSGTEHFVDWLKRLMQQQHGAACDLCDLVKELPIQGLSAADQASIMAARQVVGFAAILTILPGSLELMELWDIGPEDYDPALLPPFNDGCAVSATDGRLDVGQPCEEISAAHLKWLVTLGLHLASTYVDGERTWELLFSVPDTQELNDLCEEVLALPNLRPDHRHAILIPYQVLQGILLLDQKSARTTAEVMLRGKIEARNLKLDPGGSAIISVSDLKWLIIRGVDLSVGHMENDETPEALFGSMDAGYLNDASGWGLMSPSLDQDHRHAIMIAHQAMAALLNLVEPGMRPKALARLGMVEDEVARAA